MMVRQIFVITVGVAGNPMFLRTQSARLLRRGYATASNQLSKVAHTVSAGRVKTEGTIASVFASLSDEQVEWDPRFSALKKELWKDALTESWRDVLKALDCATEEIEQKGGDIIPQVSSSEFINGINKEQTERIKDTGAVIIRGVVAQEEASQWKQSLQSYVARNANLVQGFPSDDIVFYEIYNSVAQTLARTHPAVIAVQRRLLSFWHSSDPDAAVSLDTPISYFDRFRIRRPGNMTSLGPHIDGGSIERWEDPAFRACWARILEGGQGWRKHDPWDVAPRLDAKQNLYHAANQCTVFRAWQGWTALSSTRGNAQGTLRVLPMLPLATAYLILRPFFRPRIVHGGRLPLAFEDWVVDLDNAEFPGSLLGKTQRLEPETHPHLRLDKTMVTVPWVEPGDQVYWHCDVVHAVETEHAGPGDSAVMYIPATPLTKNSAEYLRVQREHFVAGFPGPDFPGGEGESNMVGRASAVDLVGNLEGQRMLGLAPFDLPQGALPAVRQLIAETNRTLGF